MLTRLSASTRTLAAICLSGMLWAFSFGVGAPLASVWLHKAGYNDKIVGLNTGVYYLGIALAAAAVPWMMRHWGRNGLAACRRAAEQAERHIVASGDHRGGAINHLTSDRTSPVFVYAGGT